MGQLKGWGLFTFAKQQTLKKCFFKTLLGELPSVKINGFLL
jgi:hypothetical protein